MEIFTSVCIRPALMNNCKLLNACFQGFVRKLSSNSDSSNTRPSPMLKLAKLKERNILRLQGRDSIKFLQGLIPSDIDCLLEGHCKVLYTMLLNAQGRVLYDIIVHSVPGEGSQFLIDCEQIACERIVKHLTMFKLRAKIDISDASKEIEPWVIFSDELKSPISIDAFDNDNKIIALHDPRTPEVGVRVLAPWSQSPSELLRLQNYMVVDSEVYRLHRYTLGIAEGLEEIPSGNALPLEYNLALLNGVSFTKGCYIGQELTARTHHTGVIRKRIMPLSLQLNDNMTKYPDIESNTPIKGESGKSAGRICVMRGQYGLGMLRLNEALSSSVLTVKSADGKDVQVKTEIPFWWPQDLKY